jgi:hypothetical protein
MITQRSFPLLARSIADLTATEEASELLKAEGTNELSGATSCSVSTFPGFGNSAPFAFSICERRNNRNHIYLLISHVDGNTTFRA